MSREKQLDISIFLLRIVAGFLFLQYGGVKLFGWFDNSATPLFSLLGLAGTLEFFGGLAIMLGLWVRPVAFLLAGEMAFAYFMGHAMQGYFYAPLVNQGTPSVLFSFIFLFFSAYGAGRWSVMKFLKR